MDSSTRTLQNEDWNRLQEIVERFERDCLENMVNDWHDYLPPRGDPLRQTVLEEMVRIDLELHWKQNRRRLIEYYIKKFPGIGQNRTMLVQILIDEYRLRNQYGDRPNMDHYKKRFPDLYPQFKEQAPSFVEESLAPLQVSRDDGSGVLPRPGGHDPNQTATNDGPPPPTAGRDPFEDIDTNAPTKDPFATQSSAEPSSRASVDAGPDQTVSDAGPDDDFDDEPPSAPMDDEDEPDVFTPTAEIATNISSQDRPQTLADEPDVPEPADEVSPVSHTTGDGSFAMAGSFKRVRKLGQGGFGEVWEAMAPGGVPVAIKRIFGSVSPKAVEREKSSLDLICSGKLRHPFLLQVFGWWIQDNKLHIAMELAEGSVEDQLNLRRHQKKVGLAYDELRQIMIDAADALDFLNHKRDILHRDVKPANMLVMGGRLKLCDFGLSRMSTNLAYHMGRTMGAGTPLFIAPEVIEGYQSQHSDQYSLAASYYMMRTGEALFFGTAKAVRNMHLISEPQFDETIIGPREGEALMKGLAKKPENRHPNSSTFVKEIFAGMEADRKAKGRTMEEEEVRSDRRTSMHRTRQVLSLDSEKGGFDKTGAMPGPEPGAQPPRKLTPEARPEHEADPPAQDRRPLAPPQPPPEQPPARPVDRWATGGVHAQPVQPPKNKFSRTQWQHLKRKQGQTASETTTMPTLDPDTGLGTINLLLIVAVLLLTLLLGLLVTGYFLGYF